MRFASRAGPISKPQIVSPNEHARTDRAVEAAIAQVLAAERAASEAIAVAHAEAAQLGERSRAELRDLAERTQARIGRLRDALARRADAEVAALRAQADALASPQPPSDDELVRIDRAVSALAARLTGGAP